MLKQITCTSRMFILATIACCCLAQEAVQGGTPGARTPATFPREIVGRVTDANGDPVEGARVEFGPILGSAEDREATTTDAEGKYRLSVTRADHDFRVGVSAKGFAPSYRDHFRPGPLDRPAVYSPRLRAGAQVWLKLVTRSGVPAGNVFVQPMKPSHGFFSSFSRPVPAIPFPGDERLLKTDAAGQIQLTSLPPMPSSPNATEVPKSKQRPTNWFAMHVYRDPKRRGSPVVVTAADIAKTRLGEPVVVRVPDFPVEDDSAEGVIRGVVVAKETDEPVTDFVVMRRYDPQPRSIENSEGRFLLRGGERGKLRIGRVYQTRIFAPGYAVGVGRPVAQREDVLRETRFALVKHPSLRGRIVNAAGEPVENAECVAGCASGQRVYVEWSTLDSYADGHHCLTNVLRVKTDEDGGFVIPESPGQPVCLIVRAPGFAPRVVMPDRRPQPDAQGSVVIELEKGASMTVVVDRETQLGEHARGVSISTQAVNLLDDGVDHMWGSRTLADQADSITYTSLWPGDYVVSISAWSGSGTQSRCNRSVTLEEGDAKRVVVGPTGGSLTLSGIAAPFSVVTIGDFSVKADVDGYFSLRDLPAGDYIVTAAQPTSAVAAYLGRQPSLRKEVRLEEDTHVELTPPAGAVPESFQRILPKQ